MAESMEIEENAVMCDVCQTGTPMCYCTNCSKRFCEEHFSNHEEFNVNHHIVEMTLYQTESVKCNLEICSGHGLEKVLRGCGKCYKLFCISCSIQCFCIDQHTSHTIHSVEDLAIKLREELQKDLTILPGKIAPFVKLEDEAKLTLVMLKERFRDMKEEIDRAITEQTVEKKIKNMETRDKICLYFRRSRGLIQQYLTDLQDGIKKLEYIRKLVDNFITTNNDVQLIQRKDSLQIRRDKIRRIKPEPSQYQIFEGFLKASGQYPHLDLTFQLKNPLPPVRLQLEVHRNTYCRSVCLTNNGDLLTSGPRNITLFDIKSGIQTLERLTIDLVCSVVNCGSGYVLMRSYEKDWVIEYYPEAPLMVVKAIDKYPKTMELQHISVCRKNCRIAAMDNGSQQIKFYTAEGDFLFDAKVPDIKTTCGIHALPDGTILLSNKEGGCINRYQVGDGTLNLLWSCTGLLKPTALCSDDEGYIYAGSFAGNVIYILSEHGVKLKALYPKGLGNLIVTDLAANDKVLAVACLGAGLRTYKISRDLHG